MNVIFRKHKFESLLTAFVMVTGVVLALIQYLLNRSLWNDEAMLALNIIGKNSFELLKPLDYNQVAPILFLQITKLFSQVLPAEYGLRLLPLLCYFASIIWFRKLLALLYNDRFVVLFGMMLFVLNTFLVYFSSEFKQYMCDVLVVILNFYFLIKQHAGLSRKVVVLSIFGTISIFFSNVAPIILAISGVYLIWSVRNDLKSSLKPLLYLFFVWNAVFSVYFFLFIYNHPVRDYMISFWTKHNAFMPYNILSREFYSFFEIFFTGISQHLMPYGTVGFWFLPVLLLMGLFSYLKTKNFGIIIITLLPLMLHLLLSMFRMYPAIPRLMLYFIPPIIVLVSGGVFWLKKTFFSTLSPKLLNTVSILFFVFSFYFLIYGSYPQQRHEVRDSIDYIEQNLSENESIFITSPATYPFIYYSTMGYLSSGIPSTKGFIQNTGAIKKQLSKYKGIWVLTAGSKVSKYIECSEDFKEQGLIIVNKFETKGSAAYLIRCPESE